MKKLLYGLLIVTFMIFPSSVFAKGYITPSPTSLTIEQGSSKTFTITAFNAVGDVSIVSSNSSVAQVSAGSWTTGAIGDNQTVNGKITVKGLSVGTATITLTLDASTFDDEDLAGQTKQINVTVKAKSSPAPKPNTPSAPSTNNNTNSGGGNNSVDNNVAPSVDNTVTNNLSTNNKLKEISVDGYKLVKVNDNNYTLTVATNVTGVNVKATAADAKAKVTGVGKKELKIGENNIEVIVTSEAGVANKINLKIIRKDGYYLEDLDTVLNDNKITDINIIIKNDTKVTSSDLEKIKKSKKTVKLNYFDKNKKVIYSYVIDGSKINKTQDFLTTITYTSEKAKEIKKVANYAEGLNISLKHKEDLPKGTKLRIFVGDKFSDGDIVNVYYYNEKDNKLELVQKELIVKDGYIEYNVLKGTDYLVTMSDLSSIGNNSSNSKNIFMILCLIDLVIIIAFIVINYLMLKKEGVKENE